MIDITKDAIGRKLRREGVIGRKLRREGVNGRKLRREGVNGRKLRREGVNGTPPGGASSRANILGKWAPGEGHKFGKFRE